MTSIRDRGLKRTFAPMTERLAQGEQLGQTDVQALISSAQDGPGVTKTERKDLDRILRDHGADMDPVARETLQAFVEAQGGGTGGGTPPPDTVSLLGMRIDNATIRKALTGADGESAILADKSVDMSEVNRLIDIVEKNGIVSNTEKRGLRTLLANPQVTIVGRSRAVLEQVAGSFHEPAPHQTISGADLQSAHVDANQTYRTAGLPTALLRQAGVSPAVCDLLDRADQLGSGGQPGDHSGAAGAAELAALEAGGALLPAEVEALGAAWKLLEVSRLDAPDAVTVPDPLAVEDLSVRPGDVDASEIAVDVSSLPDGLQTLAQRARLVHLGSGADLEKVTVEDIKYAIDNDHGETTAADRSRMQSELIDVVRPLAIENGAVDPQAKVRVPDLGSSDQLLASAGDMAIGLTTKTAMAGFVRERAVWTPLVKRHDRGATAHYPPAIPKSSDIGLDIERDHILDVDIPAGHKLVLVGKDLVAGQNHVLSGGQVQIGADVRAGDYRALLMKDGEVVEETALRLQGLDPETLDVSDYYGFQMETESGGQVTLNRSNQTSGNASSSFTEGIIAIVSDSSSGHTLPGHDKRITLEPGRYEGSINVAYNTPKDFSLDVLSDTVLEATVDGKRFQLYPVEKSPTVYEGHFDEEGTQHLVFRFHPETNKLSAIEDKMDTWHGSSGWYAEVESRERGAVTINDVMRTG